MLRKTMAIAALACVACGGSSGGGDEDVLATVRGKPVTRDMLVAVLERDHGRRELDELVSEVLVADEADKQKISVSDEEIKAELEARVKRDYPGHTPEELAKVQNKSLDALRDEARHQILLRKLAKPKVEVSDDDIKTRYEQTKARFPNKSLDDVKDQIRAELVYQREQAEAQRYLYQLRQKAKIKQYPERLDAAEK